MNATDFLTAFPITRTNYGTGGGCTAWYLLLPDRSEILVTEVDDANQPAMTDERVGIQWCDSEGNNDERGDWLPDVTWADAIEFVRRKYAIAGVVA